jgi:hypothetical protein
VIKGEVEEGEEEEEEGGERRAWFIGTSRGKIKKMSKFTVFGQII